MEQDVITNVKLVGWINKTRTLPFNLKKTGRNIAQLRDDVFLGGLINLENSLSPRKYPRHSSAISREMLQGPRTRCMYIQQIRMKIPRAKGKRASSTEEHISSSCGQVCAQPEVPTIQESNNVPRKRLTLVCPLGRLPRGATRPPRQRWLEDVSKI